MGTWSSLQPPRILQAPDAISVHGGFSPGKASNPGAPVWSLVLYRLGNHGLQEQWCKIMYYIGFQNRILKKNNLHLVRNLKETWKVNLGRIRDFITN